MNKKSIISILMALAMTLNIGCTANGGGNSLKSKEIVFEENVMDSSNSSIKITQEEINFIVPEGYKFDFGFYNSGKLYGSLSDERVTPYRIGAMVNLPLEIRGEDQKLYVANDEFEVEETEQSILVYNEDEGVKGLNSEWVGEDRHSVNYFNYETNEFESLFRKKYESNLGRMYYTPDGKETTTEKLIEGNNNFGYSLYNYAFGDEKLVSIRIVDLTTKEVYEYEDKGTECNFIIDILYDNVTESFYAINEIGVIYELTFKNNVINFKEFDTIDLSGIALLYENQVTINKDGEIILMYQFKSNSFISDGSTTFKPLYDEKIMKNAKDSSELLVIYKPSVKTIERIMQGDSKNFEVVEFWRESNLCLLEKGKQEGQGQEYYIGELKEDRIDIYHKVELDVKEDDCIWIYNVLMNDDDTELIIQFKATESLNGSEEYFSEYYYPYGYKDYVVKLNIER